MTKVCSIFSQLLQLFPRWEFERLVRETQTERHARGFTCWGQFVAMLFCQLGRAHSLREICGGLASCEGKLSHWEEKRCQEPFLLCRRRTDVEKTILIHRDGEG